MAMGIVLKHAKQASTLRLDGVLDISVAGELKSALLKAIAAGKPIHISAEGVSDFDITAYQLLWAAEREANGRSIQFSLPEQMPLPIKNAMSELGLDAMRVS
jgi:anti-anti-sigma regulatory factor